MAGVRAPGGSPRAAKPPGADCRGALIPARGALLQPADRAASRLRWMMPNRLRGHQRIAHGGGYQRGSVAA